LMKVLGDIASTTLHLLEGHSHPRTPSLEWSAMDHTTAASRGLTYQALHGQRQLVDMIVDEGFDLNRAKILLYCGNRSQPIEVIRCAQLPSLPRNEYFEIGSLLTLIHRCQKPVFPIELS